MKNNEIKRLLVDFAEAKVAHVKSLYDEGETAKHASDKYIKAAEQLISLGPLGINAFATLLTDQRREVRSAAATFLLPYHTDAAVETLQETASGNDVTAFAARMTLARWEGGDRKMWEEIEVLSEKANLSEPRKRFEC